MTTARLLKLYLLLTGAAAFISVLMPGLVVLGLFLILPGLILVCAPTAFLWGCVFATAWFALRPRLGGWVTAVLALVVTIGLLLLAPLPSRAVSTQRLAASVRPDILPATPAILTGHVRLDMPASELEPQDRTRPSTPRAVRCNALCAAALFTEGVTSVTLNPLGYALEGEAAAIGEAALAANARTFRLVPRDRCAESLRPTGAAGLGTSIEEVRALEAEWSLRLSTRDCIIAEPTRTVHDAVIAQASYTLHGRGSGWDLGPRGVHVTRLEIRSGSAVLLRKLIATTEALARPLRIGAGGSLESFHFGWERETWSNAPRFASLDAGKLLRAYTNLAVHADPAATARLVRERLQAMLADPAVTATDPGWAAAEAYLRALKPNGVTEADRALLPALIRDRRMTRFDGLWEAIRALGPDGGLLRGPMVERLADRGPGEQAEAIRNIGAAIASLPPGTFEHQTPAEGALLADPAVRRRARGLIARQSDRGEAAVPELLDIVAYHARAVAAARIEQSRRSRSGDNSDLVIVDAARTAFCRLGPSGSAALPRLIELRGEPGLERVLSFGEEWTFTLARLGQPIESFTKPESVLGTPEQFHANLHRRLQSFRPDRDCRARFV